MIDACYTLHTIMAHCVNTVITQGVCQTIVIHMHAIWEFNYFYHLCPIVPYQPGLVCKEGRWASPLHTCNSGGIIWPSRVF